MTALVWDQVGERRYETGLDKGVLYLPDGTAIPWNGLLSVVEKNDADTTSVYYEGSQINELVSVSGGFLGTLKALTYPDEFQFLEGYGVLTEGVFIGNQRPTFFDLSYRTVVGNDVDGTDFGYKIHILYNVLAIPNDRNYETIAADPNLINFEWDIFAVPQEIPGMDPSAHAIIDSRVIDPDLLSDLEDLLYGTPEADPDLPTMAELGGFVDSWHMPSLLVEDSFNRGDGNLAGSFADVGGMWTNVGYDTWGTVSNVAKVTGVTTGMGACKIGSPRADVEMVVDYQHLEPSRGHGGLFARFQDVNNYYFCHYHNGGIPRSLRVDKVVSGGAVLVGEYILGYDINAGKMGFRIIGDQLTVLWDDVELDTFTDSEIASPGAYGMMFWTSSGWSDFQVDNFKAYSAG